ncbi:hypothetical protein F5Y00DRAFT_229830 [Daldinia vernicosa]|uniref:uncharacterized protein n=1 Tax=Daldinia vernicosa TaxID=114800 RepID=UPI0020079844|nr:uncharacterized protein F5Y00DRAFT_229830 [Daldinia vernicosa]KAI0851483.1 hypothetical protein F5Y00DRAFT_229830 [Daldinia vernicosa]
MAHQPSHRTPKLLFTQISNDTISLPTKRRHLHSSKQKTRAISQITETTTAPSPSSLNSISSFTPITPLTSSYINSWRENIEPDLQDPNQIPPSPKEPYIPFVNRDDQSIPPEASVSAVVAKHSSQGASSVHQSGNARYREIYLEPNLIIFQKGLFECPKPVKKFYSKFLQPTQDILNPIAERKRRFRWYFSAQDQRNRAEIEVQLRVMHLLDFDLHKVQPYEVNTPFWGSMTTTWLLQQIVRQCPTKELCQPIIPKPDLAYGYDAKHIPHLAKLSRYLKSDKIFTSNSHGFCFPYFIIEFKGTRPIAEAENQILNSASSALFTYNKIIQGGYVFCASIREDIIHFYIMWPTPNVSVPDNPRARLTKYTMICFATFVLIKPAEYKKCLMLISNIQRWGQGERFDRICSTIEKIYTDQKDMPESEPLEPVEAIESE